MTGKQSIGAIKMQNVHSELRNGLVRYASNPFTKNMHVPTRAKRDSFSIDNRDMTVSVAVEGEGKQVIDCTHVNTWHQVDSEEFTKIYTHFWAINKNLNKAGRTVWQYVANRIQQEIGRDKITLSFQLIDQDLHISEATYQRGLKALIQAELIAPTLYESGSWWINPNLVFNGNRRKLVMNTTYEEVNPITGEIH